MAGKKRHAAAEIAAKLVDADALAKNGQPRAEIAKALGISVMTLHRWRKMREQQAPSVPTRTSAVSTTMSSEDHHLQQQRVCRALPNFKSKTPV